MTCLAHTRRRRELAPSPSPQFTLSVELAESAPAKAIERLSMISQRVGAVARGSAFCPGGAREARVVEIDCSSAAQMDAVRRSLTTLGRASILAIRDRTLEEHRGGKLFTGLKRPLRTEADLARAYTPGVARVCLEIAADRSKAFDYTIKKNTVAVISDGSAVLGLGDIGPEAAMPVMEGKAMLFKEFADIDAVPICLDTRDPARIVEAVSMLAPAFGGINLEDISAPRCFDVEERLRDEVDIPVFHDDQHGTAIVTLAALSNACEVTDRRLHHVSVGILGAGAAGVAVARILLAAGVGEVVVADRLGLLSRSRSDYRDRRMNAAKAWLVENTNPNGLSGGPSALLADRDVFVGLAVPGSIHPQDVSSMRPDPIIFAMANPTPELMPEEVVGRVAVMATGRSDYPNQINNVLAFPGVFRGTFDVRARQIDDEMKLAAARAIATAVPKDQLARGRIMPNPLDRAVVPQVASAVARAARRHRDAIDD